MLINISMKKTLLLVLMIVSTVVSFGQTDLQVQSSEKGLFINHTVNAKENFYSVGRLYNISPKDIAAYNNLDMNNGLSVGQTIMIPLTPGNFSQETPSGVPVYYVVGEKEGLYRVSLKNNKVLMANLRKWNRLTSDNISTGQKLIVGFINTAELPKNDVAISPAKETPPPAETPRQKDTESVPQRKTEAEKPAPSKPSISSAQTAVLDANGGYFKTLFEQQGRAIAANKEQTATAGIFKTASGWQDAKYYALMDGVEPGTIIRVINPTNNKAIYAKVLGQMSGIRQNQGLDVRISNAAANVLNIGDTEKFIVKVNY